MGFDIGSALTSGINSAVGGVPTASAGMGMGLLGNLFGQQQQFNQAQKLQGLQLAGQEQLMDYGENKQFDLWQKTNYPEQVRQLEKAGLNPALLYGKGGGGGASTGSSGAQVSGQMAQSGGGIAGMGLLNPLQEAQRKNIEADTKNKEATTPNIVKTGGLIDAQTSNTNQAAALAKVNTDLAEIQRYIAGQTKDLTIDQIIQQTRQITQDADKGEISLFIDRATQNSVVDRIRAEGIGAILQNALTASGTALNEQQIRESANNILQKWKQISQQGRAVSVQEGELILDQEMQKYNLTPSWKKAINSVIGGISSVTHVAGQIGVAAMK